MDFYSYISKWILIGLKYVHLELLLVAWCFWMSFFVGSQRKHLESLWQIVTGLAESLWSWLSGDEVMPLSLIFGPDVFCLFFPDYELRNWHHPQLPPPFLSLSACWAFLFSSYSAHRCDTTCPSLFFFFVFFNNRIEKVISGSFRGLRWCNILLLVLPSN